MNEATSYKSSVNSSAVGDGMKDFRARAVAASEMMRRTLPSGLSPETSRVSCCLVRQPDLSGLRMPIKVIAALCMVLGLCGLASGATVLLIVNGIILANRPSALGIAVCCTVGGILSMPLPTFVERWFVRRHLCQRGESPASNSDCEGIHIALEHAPTYDSIKILAEDVGLIYVHPEARYVRISGLSYEYVIQAKDVVGLSLHSKGKSVLLSYMVGNERLDLVLIPRSLRAELERQTVGSSRSLFAKVQEALTP